MEIDSEGSFINLHKTEESVRTYDLSYPYKLPDRQVDGLFNKIRLDKKNGKYTYVEFWGTWCKPCIALIPELKDLNKYYSDRINLISVNYNDKNLDLVKRFVELKNMNWDQIVADEQLENEFGNPHFVPCGILFNPEGYLVKYGIDPDEVITYLNNKKI